MINWYHNKITEFTKFIDERVYQRFIPNHEVDFSKNWISLFFNYKGLLFVSFLFLSLEKSIEAYSPFIISDMLEKMNFNNFYLLIFLYIIAFLFSITGFQIAARMTTRIEDDLDISAVKKILSMDPVHNSTKSSGTIISKLKRAIGAIQVIAFNLILDLPMKVIYIGMSIFFTFKIDSKLGFIVLSIVTTSLLVNIIYIKFIFKNIKKQSIETDDKYVEVVLENISQSQLIRASFATTERYELMQEKQKIKNFSFLVRDHSYTIIYQLTKAILTLSIIILTFFIYNLVKENRVTTPMAIAIVTSYIIASFQIILLGSQIIRIFGAITDINDMMKFMNEAGSQSYPVLKEI